MISCAGCAKLLLPSGTYEVELVPGHKALVCRGRRYNCPSFSCMTKARIKLKLCPGCGEKSAEPATICNGCDALIAKGKDREARKVLWWKLSSKYLGPYLSLTDDTVPVTVEPEASSTVNERLAKLLAKAITSGRVASRYESPGWGSLEGRDIPEGGGGENDDPVYIELTAEQGTAARQLVKEIRHVMRLQFKDGWDRGSDALGRLMTGDMTVQDFDKYKEDVERMHKQGDRGHDD